MQKREDFAPNVAFDQKKTPSVIDVYKRQTKPIYWLRQVKVLEKRK